QAEIEIEEGVLRPVLLRLSQHGRCSVELLRIVQAAPEIDMAFHAIRGDSDGLAIGPDRFVDSSAISQIISERNMRLEQLRVQGDGPAKSLLRTVAVTGIFQSDSIVEPKRAERGSQFNRAPELAESGLPPCLLLDEAEIGKGGREGGMCGEYAAIACFCFGELSRLVEAHGLLHGIGWVGRHHWHSAKEPA